MAHDEIEPCPADAGSTLPRSYFERAVVEEAPDLHLVLLDDDVGQCVFACGGGEVDPADLEGHSLFELVEPRDEPALRAGLVRARAGGRASVPLHLRLPGRASRSCEIVLRRPVRRPDRPLLLAVLRDLDLAGAGGPAHAAGFDVLTGLATRAVFADRVQHALDRLRRGGRAVALLFIDLDRFKSVNDTYGHQSGDDLLRVVTSRVRDVLRPSDTLARLGGDEFAVLLEDLASPTEAVLLAQRVAEVGRVPVTFDDGRTVLCTMSVGVTVTDDPVRDVAQLLHEADMAMYRAKERGRDRVELFDELLRQRIAQRLATEELVRRAVHERLLRVEYQPVVRVPDELVVSFEAVLRVDLGEVEQPLPPDFLEVASSAGLTAHMTSWVLDRAVGQAVRWHRTVPPGTRLPVRLAVSGRDLARGQFGSEVLARLQQHDLPAELLHLELEEELLRRATPAVTEQVAVLRRAGVRIGLSDFGTFGAGSLVDLATYPVDFVKLDPSLVARLAEGHVPRAVVRALVDVGHAVGVRVVAGGVASREVLAVLADLGCDEVQGVLWGTGVDAEGVLAFVTGGPGSAAGSPGRRHTSGPVL